jgi:YHS domain-containing protein/thiol-disulfide isomerase/thioredoxin
MRRTPTPGLLMFVVWAAACAPAHADARHDGWMTDYDQALALARQQQKPLLIHFYADWCGPCKKMEQTVLNRPEVLAEIRKSVIAVKINTDSNPVITEKFGITALPTDVVIEPGGARLIESIGPRSLSEYRTAITRAATRYNDFLAKRAPRTSPPPAQPNPQQPAQQVPAELVDTDELQPMLDGYCPVTLWSNRRWEKGSPQFRADYRGQVYLLTSQEHLQEFHDNPDRYAPRFLGCDAVVVYESDRAVLGSTRYAAFYDNELYLFVDDINRQAFKRNPDNYVRTRVVLSVDQIETVTQ